jgi:hypothetical protein
MGLILNHMDEVWGYAVFALLSGCHLETLSHLPWPPDMASGLQDVPL